MAQNLEEMVGHLQQRLGEAQETINRYHQVTTSSGVHNLVIIWNMINQGSQGEAVA